MSSWIGRDSFLLVTETSPRVVKQRRCITSYNWVDLKPPQCCSPVSSWLLLIVYLGSQIFTCLVLYWREHERFGGSERDSFRDNFGLLRVRSGILGKSTNWLAMMVCVPNVWQASWPEAAHRQASPPDPHAVERDSSPKKGTCCWPWGGGQESLSKSKTKPHQSFGFFHVYSAACFLVAFSMAENLSQIGHRSLRTTTEH